MKIELLKSPISELLDGTLIFSYPNEKIWNPKGISLKNRISSGALLQGTVASVLTPVKLKKYVVPVNPKAPTRCIDGRITVGWESLSKEQKNSLGPKIAGGTAHAALAHRIVDSTSIREDLLFEHDIQYVVDRYKSIDIGFGGHVDTHQHGWNTGCGAIDNINLILERLQRPEPQEQIRGLAKIILGDAYDGSHIANEVIGRMLFLDALKPSYMPKENNKPSGEFLYKKRVVELLRKQASKNEEAVPSLAGSHGEVAIVLNFIKGTTFDTDRFSFDNNNEIQVFGWDIWEMFEEAKRLYPYTMRTSPTTQRRSIAKRQKHITTRTLLGLATAMVLTDGSLRVVTIT